MAQRVPANLLYTLQEGQFLDPEEVKKVLTKEQILQIEVKLHCRSRVIRMPSTYMETNLLVILYLQTVCAGSWISKFTNHGKGALHPRFFQVNPSNLKVHLHYRASFASSCYIAVGGDTATKPVLLKCLHCCLA